MVLAFAKGGHWGHPAAMDEYRLPTELWVTAHMRRCSVEGVPATIVRKGEPTFGTVVLKLNHLGDGCRVLTQARDTEGRLGWLAALDGALVPEADADAYIARTLDLDEDAWVIEIEHRDGWHPFEGKVL